MDRSADDLGSVISGIQRDLEELKTNQGTGGGGGGGGETYYAGNGIEIDNSNTISIDTDIVATQTDLEGKADVSDIPTKTSQLNNDSGYITSSSLPTKTSELVNDGSDGTSTYVEADELATVATSGSYSDLIGTPSLATVATTGDYDDLIDKPTIPTVNNATLTITQNGTSAGTFTANQSTDATIALTDTTYSAMTGATSSTAGTGGLVPAPAAGDQEKYLRGDGTWQPAGSSSDIPDGSVTTAKLADGAVTPAKINWSSFGCIESSFCFTNKGDTETVTVTTNKGTQLTIGFISNGTPFIISGGSDIMMMDVRTSAHFSSNITSGYAIVGIGNGSTVWTRTYRQFANGSSTSSEIQNNQSWSTTIGGQTCYGAIFASVGSGAKSSFATEYTVVKNSGGDTNIFGKAGASGSNTSISFEAIVTSLKSGMIPGILQSDAFAATSTNFSYIKVYEAAS